MDKNVNGHIRCPRAGAVIRGKWGDETVMGLCDGVEPQDDKGLLQIRIGRMVFMVSEWEVLD